MRTETVELSVSYGKPDVLKFCRFMFNTEHHGCEWLQRNALSQKHTEQDILYTFEHAPQVFGNYMEKWAKQLAAWCLTQAIKEGYIVKSKIDDNCFYFTEICIEKKRGRHKKEDTNARAHDDG